MYLSDYLHDIPLKALKRIAGRLGVSVEYQARIKLMNAIDRAFWDGVLIRRLISGLSEKAKLALSLVAFSYDAGVPESLLLRKMDRFTGARRREVRDIMDGLMLSALVGGLQREDPLYFSPRGVAEPVRALFMEEFFDLSAPSRTVPPSAFPNLMEDIIALLAAAYREPVMLTLKGGIRRNELDRIFAGSLTGQETPEYFSRDQRDTFVAEFLSARKLLVWGEREATVTPALDGWLNLNMTERTRDVAAFALRHVFGDSQTIVPFAGIMTELPAGTLIDPEGLARFLHRWTTASGSAARIQSRTLQILSIFHHLGILVYRNDRFIMTGTGFRFFRGERLPLDESISDRFTLQPNFEALAGPELDLRTRFTLELMSNRKGRDIVVTYVVSRSGVARARERGMSVSEIMRFFENHSRTPVPQNIRFSIESWAKAFGNIRFEPVMLMRFQDSAICDSVMHMPEMRHYLRERLSDTIITVPAERIRVIAEILRQSGFLPDVPGESVPDPARSGERYQPSSIPEILSAYTLPDSRKNFVFPGEEPAETAPDKDTHE
jgi:hypothetical protein